MTTESPAPPLSPARICYDDVVVGQILPPISFLVTRADVEDYRASVGSRPGADPSACSKIAAMHLLALTLAAITERMPLPATCVHVGQEMSWCSAVEADAEIVVRFCLLSRRTAGGTTFSAFSLHLASAGVEVAAGRILLQS